MEQHDVGGIKPHAEQAALHVRIGFFRVFGHAGGIPIGAGIGLAEQHVEKPENLLPPRLAVLVHLNLRFKLIQTHKPRGETVGNGQGFQRRQHGREAFLRQPVQNCKNYIKLSLKNMEII